ncbi:hypothetical protein EOD41_09825 [Mucilaginibacter limnophilus]|uniref:Uncharacterized protein n=1 Tax=Mucilaginibacter limnophilus TaxID=1932778 RepID=A0A437MTF7_9SPHI|nr:hypothetical protein [Mucilaginibacter limnophilus]RVU00923.1 hypothetical protein EOD41_09825 [Mucilaginibacter limnophilus]
MRIQIDFDKKNRSQSIIALERFLNLNLIEINHGHTFDAIFITFIENPKKSQKYKRRFLYKKYADISVPCQFQYYADFSLENFRAAFFAVLNAINFIDEIEVKTSDFNSQSLKSDLSNLEVLIPKTTLELSALINNGKDIDKQIHLKRMVGLLNRRKENRKPLIKEIKEVRIYDKKRNLELRPYLNIFSEILTSELKLIKPLSPGYSEIYFSLSDTIDDARSEFALEDWYEYSYVVLDYNHFFESEEKERFQILYILFANGLMELVKIDGLNKFDLDSCILGLKRRLNHILDSRDFLKIIDELKLNKLGEKILLNRK